ncbi:CbiX/SirB N-terminal domain-containing protein [Rhodoferax sp. 4810]|nr:CbiX/SirB N-terminal domain-containing protein [Rhodoferax jenense]
MTPSPHTAIVLFAHGSRDPAWRLPLEAVLARVQSQHPGLCRLAFLELMQPSLPDTLADLAALGCQHSHIKPLFWAAGKHVNRDLVDIVAAFSQDQPEVRVEVAPPLGDNAQMRDAIAAWALGSSSLHAQIDINKSP